MRVNNVNNQTNFGMKDVIASGASRALSSRIERIKSRLLRAGNQSSMCYIGGTDFIAKARVKIPVDRWGATVIEDHSIGTALTDDALVALVENAHSNASQKFMDSFNFSKPKD